MKKIIIAAMMAATLVGCASSGNSKLKNETEVTMQSKIKEGVTTKHQIKEMLGSPDNVSFTDSGKEIWKYSFAKVKVDGKSFIPFYGLFHNGTNGTNKELTMLFKGDTVEKYTMSESAISTKTGWAD